MDAQCASSFRMRVDGGGIPTYEIKVSVSGVGITITPWVSSLKVICGAVRRAMPLRLTWQRFSCPSGVRARLRMTGVHRPIEGQRKLIEHGPVIPGLAQ